MRVTDPNKILNVKQVATNITNAVFPSSNCDHETCAYRDFEIRTERLLKRLSDYTLVAGGAFDLSQVAAGLELLIINQPGRLHRLLFSIESDRVRDVRDALATYQPPVKDQCPYCLSDCPL